MNFKSLICYVTAILLCYSCKKDTVIKAPITAKNNSTSSTSYINLQIGNYWVYNLYQVDSAGAETFMNKTDSIYIQKDSIVGGKTYYLLNRTDTSLSFAIFPWANSWLTDSSGFIYSMPHDRCYLDPIHLNDTIRKDTTSFGAIYLTIPMSFTNASVPAGLFSGISMNMRERFVGSNPWNGNPLIITYYKYAIGIGLIHAKTGFAGQPNAGQSGYAYKLIRYHI